MTNQEFDRWCAEVVMGWEQGMEIVEGMFSFLDAEGFSRVVGDNPDIGPAPDWSPSTDLNAMREVEMRIEEISADQSCVGPNIYEEHLDSLLDIYAHSFDLDSDNIVRESVATASVEQRKEAILAIKDQIEEALK